MTETEIYQAFHVLKTEPSFDTFEASPNYYYFPELCKEFNISMKLAASYGDLLILLEKAAAARGFLTDCE